MFRHAALAIACLALSLAGEAQVSKCPKLPVNYHWESARDYKRDEDLAIRTLRWLVSTPLNSDLQLRGDANLFVMEWICGSPRIEINIQTEALPFYAEYPDLLFPYIHGVAYCYLSKNTDCNELQAQVEGFNTVAFMVRTDAKLSKVKSFHALLKAYKKGKMASYVESLKSNKESR
jgi:hypothetical protein